MNPPNPRPHWSRDRWSADGAVTRLTRPARTPRPLRFDASPGPVEVDLSRCAFIIIDMQNDFLHPEGWTADARGIDVSMLTAPIGPINALAAGLRAADVPVIHVNWGIRADLANLPPTVLDKPTRCGAVLGYGEEARNGPVLTRGSWGARSVEAVQVGPHDLVVDKHRLSGFRDNELAAVLRRLDVTTVFYAGVNYDRCVFATLMDGAFEGFDPIAVTDTCATVASQQVIDATTTLIEGLYGFTAESPAILAALNPKE